MQVASNGESSKNAAYLSAKWSEPATPRSAWEANQVVHHANTRHFAAKRPLQLQPLSKVEKPGRPAVSLVSSPIFEPRSRRFDIDRSVRGWDALRNLLLLDVVSYTDTVVVTVSRYSQAGHAKPAMAFFNVPGFRRFTRTSFHVATGKKSDKSSSGSTGSGSSYKPPGDGKSSKTSDPNTKPEAGQKPTGSKEDGASDAQEYRQQKILILMSDTGGGHRASANALKAAFLQQYGDRFDIDVLDLWSDHMPWPFNQLPKTYTFLANHPLLWKFVWNMGLGEGRKMMENVIWKCSERRLTRAIETKSPDMIVSVHPLMQELPLRVVEKLNAKRAEATTGSRGGKILFTTVVTDLGSAHPTWFNPAVDRCYVPSTQLYQLALESGLVASQIRQYGLPIRLDFADPALPKKILRQAFGLLPDVPVVLLVGGGDGIGRVAHIAKAVASQLAAAKEQEKEKKGKDVESLVDGDAKEDAKSKVGKVAVEDKEKAAEAKPAKTKQTASKAAGDDLAGGKLSLPAGQMVVICGKNKRLRRQLEKHKWEIPVVVNGFVNNMSDWMAASDCIITKAGPGTIAEAMARGLPIMLSGFIPGQEAGNVPYVIDNNIGAYSSDPKQIAAAVARWVSKDGSQELQAMSRNAYNLSNPKAAITIAHDIASMVAPDVPASAPANNVLPFPAPVASRR